MEPEKAAGPQAAKLAEGVQGSLGFMSHVLSASQTANQAVGPESRERDPSGKHPRVVLGAAMFLKSKGPGCLISCDGLKNKGTDRSRKGEKSAPCPIFVLLLPVLPFSVNYNFVKVSENGTVGFGSSLLSIVDANCLLLDQSYDG